MGTATSDRRTCPGRFPSWFWGVLPCSRVTILPSSGREGEARSPSPSTPSCRRCCLCFLPAGLISHFLPSRPHLSRPGPHVGWAAFFCLPGFGCPSLSSSPWPSPDSESVAPTTSLSTQKESGPSPWHLRPTSASCHLVILPCHLGHLVTSALVSRAPRCP